MRGDWDRPYLTMHPAYEAAVLEVLRQLVEAGLIYRGLKPVYWCTTARRRWRKRRSSIASTKRTSIYVAFPVLALPEALFPEEDRARMAAVIWTTTPWTLPANVAVAVHPDVSPTRW